MKNTAHKTLQRERRHARVRAKVSGTLERPRLSVYRSNMQLIAQVIDDEAGKTVASIRSGSEKGKTPRDRAIAAGKAIAQAAIAKGVKKVVFDRGGFEYSGSIQAFAESARSAGLEF